MIRYIVLNKSLSLYIIWRSISDGNERHETKWYYSNCIEFADILTKEELEEKRPQIELNSWDVLTEDEAIIDSIIRN